MKKSKQKRLHVEGEIVRGRLIRELMRPRQADGHKYTFGHSLIIAGSGGKGGAAVIAAKAAMRTGCGLVTVMLPPEYEGVLLHHLPEAMVITAGTLTDFSKFDSIGFGPGAGTTNVTADLLYAILKNYQGTLVIDADGLTILSEHKDWISLLSPRVILTPHIGEFDRLIKVFASPEERIVAQRAFSKKTGAAVLLKGPDTTIATDGKMFINSTGNSGMATAGSGDALTGIITSLCGQGYSCSDAVIAGAYIHGYAGDIAAKELSEHSMLASDLTDRICRFFLKFT